MDKPYELIRDVEEKTQQIFHETLNPIGLRFGFEVAPSASEMAALPTILFLGNHSSGKSSFINWLVGEEVQRTGIAPIDDGFTIVTYGAPNDSRDGGAVVTNPELPWTELRQFGPELVTHLRLKYRPVDSLRGITLVDSPVVNIDAVGVSVFTAHEDMANAREPILDADGISFEK